MKVLCVHPSGPLYNPRPTRELLPDRRKYFIGMLDPASIEFSRGCPWDCAFCSAWTSDARDLATKDDTQKVAPLEMLVTDVLADHSERGFLCDHSERGLYHRERNHQGVGNRLLTHGEPAVRPANGNAPVERRERLGGLLNFYYRRAS